MLTGTFLFGIAAASLIFLSSYGGMVSLAQVSIYGIAAFVLGNCVTTGTTCHWRHREKAPSKRFGARRSIASCSTA